MSFDVHAYAPARAPWAMNPIAEPRELKDPPKALEPREFKHPPKTLDSFGRRSPSKFFVDKIPNTAKYPKDSPTRNLLGASEISGRMTEFSRASKFVTFLKNYFHIGYPPADKDKGDSFFHAVNVCLSGNETVDTSVESHLRAMAFEDKGGLDMLRTLNNDLERNPGVPVTSAITPSALAKYLGICITVFRTAKSKISEHSKNPRRTTYSGDAGQCVADREIFLLRDDGGFQSLLPKDYKGLEDHHWDDFWKTILKDESEG